MVSKNITVHTSLATPRWCGSPCETATPSWRAQEWTSPPWYSSGTQMVWEPRNGPALHGTAQVHRWYGSPGMDQPSMVQLRYTDGMGAQEWTSPPWYSSGTQMVWEPRNGPALHGTAQVHRWYGSPGMDQPSMVQLRHTRLLPQWCCKVFCLLTDISDMGKNS